MCPPPVATMSDNRPIAWSLTNLLAACLQDLFQVLSVSNVTYSDTQRCKKRNCLWWTMSWRTILLRSGYYQTTCECLLVNCESEWHNSNKNSQLWLEAEHTPVTLSVRDTMMLCDKCLQPFKTRVHESRQPRWHKLDRSVNLLGFAQWTPRWSQLGFAQSS